MKRIIAFLCLLPLGCATTPLPLGRDVSEVPLSAHMGLHVPASEPSCRSWGNIYEDRGVIRSRRFCGSTTNGEPAPAHPSDPSNAIPHATLLVEGMVKGRLMLFRFTSDTAVHFCSPALPPGKYQVRACSGWDNGAGFNLTAFVLVISPDADRDRFDVPITLGV